MSLDRLQTMLRYEVVVPNLWEANPHFEGAGDSRDEGAVGSSIGFVNDSSGDKLMLFLNSPVHLCPCEAHFAAWAARDKPYEQDTPSTSLRVTAPMPVVVVVVVVVVGVLLHADSCRHVVLHPSCRRSYRGAHHEVPARERNEQDRRAEVHDMIKMFFDGKELRRSINPDEVNAFFYSCSCSSSSSSVGSVI